MKNTNKRFIAILKILIIKNNVEHEYKPHKILIQLKFELEITLFS